MATTTRPPRPSTASRARRIVRAAPFPLWAAFCFFASGAAGLLYEIVWSKQIAYLLGASLHSVATGNLLPATVRIICVDNNTDTITKLMDRGTRQAFGLVTDCQFFLKELAARLEGRTARVG